MTKKLECSHESVSEKHLGDSSFSKQRCIEDISKDAWSYHFWYGIELGYPLCCIIWFCDSQTNHGLQQGSIYEEIYREAYDSVKITNKANIKSGRSMCPECLARAVN